MASNSSRHMVETSLSAPEAYFCGATTTILHLNTIWTHRTQNITWSPINATLGISPVAASFSVRIDPANCQRREPQRLTHNLSCFAGYEAETGRPQILQVGPPRGNARPSSPSQFISISPLEYNKAQHDRICDVVWPRFGKKNKANVWRAQLGSVETKMVTTAYEHQRKVLSSTPKNLSR